MSYDDTPLGNAHARDAIARDEPKYKFRDECYTRDGKSEAKQCLERSKALLERGMFRIEDGQSVRFLIDEIEHVLSDWGKQYSDEAGLKPGG